jgi:hypothetical protein
MTIVMFSEVNRMKTWKIITVVGVCLVATALVTASAVAFMGGRGLYTPYGTPTATPYGINSGAINAYGGFGGMMGGGMMGRGYTYGYGVAAGGYGVDCSGWNGYVGAMTSTNGTPLIMSAAVNIAQQYVSSLANKDLTVDEVEEYTQNFYVLVKESSTGRGAFELLIDKYTGTAYPEMGPNMIWNTKYGMMSGGVMGWVTGSTSAAPMTVTVNQAKVDAQAFLSVNYPSTTVGDIDTFYGYYHIDVLQEANTYGMLSVNGYTGQVWYHTWHGAFIQAVEL